MKVGCGAIETVIRTSPVPPGPAIPWPRSLICWPLVIPAGNLDLDVFARRQPQSLRGALRRLREGNSECDGHVRPRWILGLKRRTAGAAAPTTPTKRFAENIFEATETCTRTAAPTPRRAGKAFGSKTEGLELGVRTEASPRAGARPGTKAFEAAESRLALGIDLAPIKRLALGFIAKDFVGRVQLGKTRGRFRIVFVGVGMQLLRRTAKCALDVG